MKKYNHWVALTVILLMGACGTTSKFPVSATVPAANITAKKRMTKEKNYSLEITAKDLANADRLTPAADNYSIWIVTHKYGVQNVGQLSVDRSNKVTFKTLTAFDFNEVFITAERQAELVYPAGVEIARTKI